MDAIFGATKELKEFSHIPVSTVTAHAFEKDKQNALEAPISAKIKFKLMQKGSYIEYAQWN